MGECWRYVDLGAVDAFENNAQMAVLARSTPLPYEAFRDAFLAALEGAGVALDAQPLTEVAEGALATISNRIATDDSVRRVPSDRFRAAAPEGTRVGFGNHKGKKLARAGVAVSAAGRIEASMMAGDMAAVAKAVADAEA